MELHKDLVPLVDVLEALTRVPEGHGPSLDWIDDAYALAKKFVRHSRTFVALYESSGKSKAEHPTVDAASVNILARAAFESFLVFHRLFVHPHSDDERECQYLSWRLGGYLLRRRFPIYFPQNVAVRNYEATLVRELRARLSGNSVFTALSLKERQKLLSGKWRLGATWSTIASQASLHKGFGDTFYALLCEYAHSGGLSVPRDAPGFQWSDQDRCAGAPELLMIASANMARGICALFPDRAIVLQLASAENLVDVWVKIGSRGLEQ